MNEIRRQVLVLSDRLKGPIDYVQGANHIPIVFEFKDYDIPSGGTARVYVEKPSGKAVYNDITPSVSGNTVTVNIEPQMVAEPGITEMQIEVVKDGKTLLTFVQPIRVSKSLIPVDSQNGSNFVNELMKKVDEALMLAKNQGEYAEAQGDYAKTQGDYAKSQTDYTVSVINASMKEIKTDFNAIKDIILQTESGELLLQVKDMLDDMYMWATDMDIDAIIDGSYVDTDENGGFFDTATDEDIDAIIAGTFIEESEEGSGDTTEADIQKIIDDAFKEV